MFHHPATTFSPSLLGLTKPFIYLIEDAESTANKVSKRELTDDTALASFRGSNFYIQDTQDHYSISFDVPGVKLQDVKVQVTDSVLRVAAERKTGGKTVSKFMQKFDLDDNIIDMSQVKATLADGVLTIIASKKAESAPSVITISTTEPCEVDKDGLNLSLDVPGIKLADLEVTYHRGILNIRGERIQMNSNGKRQVVSKVKRSFQLKEKLVDLGKIQAFLCDGVLTLTAPSKPKATAKVIEIPTTSTFTQSQDRLLSGESSTEAKKNEAEEVVVETVTRDEEQ